MSIGVQRAPKPISVVDITNIEKTNENDDDEDKDTIVQELPKKVDEFMSYINRVYFEGKLDQDGKQMFKSDLETFEFEELSIETDCGKISLSCSIYSISVSYYKSMLVCLC